MLSGVLNLMKHQRNTVHSLLRARPKTLSLLSEGRGGGASHWFPAPSSGSHSKRGKGCGVADGHELANNIRAARQGYQVGGSAESQEVGENGYGVRPCHGFVFCFVHAVCRFSVSGGKVMGDVIVGIVAVALIIYLFVALLHPEKF